MTDNQEQFSEDDAYDYGEGYDQGDGNFENFAEQEFVQDSTVGGPGGGNKYFMPLVIGAVVVIFLIVGYVQFGSMFFGGGQQQATPSAPMDINQNPVAYDQTQQQTPDVPPPGTEQKPTIDQAIAENNVPPPTVADPWANAAPDTQQPPQVVAPPDQAQNNSAPTQLPPTPGQAASQASGMESQTLPPPAAAPNAADAAMQTQVADLNAQITNLKTMNEQLAQQVTELQEKLNAAQSAAAVTSTPPEEKPAPVEKPKPKKVAVKKPASTVSKHWTLRSAQDGSAWIAASGQNEMRRVAVGDTVPGLGRITAIHEVGGSWVVQATQGVIRQ